MSETKTRAVSLSRLETIQSRQGMNTCDFLDAVCNHIRNENPSMTLKEGLTSYARQNSLRTPGGSSQDPNKVAIRNTVPTLDITKDCEVNLIRQHKDNSNRYSTTCKLPTGATNTIWCELAGDHMTYGIKDITIGTCALVGHTTPSTDTVDSDITTPQNVEEISFL